MTQALKLSPIHWRRNPLTEISPLPLPSRSTILSTRVFVVEGLSGALRKGHSLGIPSNKKQMREADGVASRDHRIAERDLQPV